MSLRDEYRALRDEYREASRYKELFGNLVERELQVRYKNSRVGVIWSLANPVVRALILYLVFAFVVLPFKIENYSAYVLAGFFPWTYFLTGILDAGESVSKQMPLVRKVYFPRELLPLATTVANLRHFLLSLGVLAIYLVYLYGRAAWEGHPVPLPATILLLPVLVAMQTLLIGGIALYISALNVFFEDVKFLAAVALDLLFYGVPIIYFLEQVKYSASMSPEVARLVYALFLLNPMAVIIASYRSFLLPPQTVPIGANRVLMTLNETVPWPAFLGCALICVAVFIGGYRFFNSRKWRFVEQL